jgi:uncharacterized protein (TIGR03086 family)
MPLELPEDARQEIDDLAAALAATCSVVSSLSGHEWGLPTPCTEWDVAELVRHLVRGNFGVTKQLAGGDAAFLHGSANPFAENSSTSRSRAAGTDDPPQRPTLADTLQRTSSDLLRAYATPGAPERVVILPAGNVPGAVAARIRTVDMLVHGWDICAATGHTYPEDGDVVTRALAFTARSLGSLSTDHRPFAPSREVPPGAASLDQLAGLLGRPVPWLPPEGGHSQPGWLGTAPGGASRT